MKYIEILGNILNIYYNISNIIIYIIIFLGK